MSARVTVKGNLANDPEVRFTQNGKKVTNLTIGCTPSHRDKQTDQRVDDGDPLFIDAPFWGDEHEWMAEALHKGDRVTLEGTLKRRNWEGRDGQRGTSLELIFPTFDGRIDKPRQQGGYGQGGDQQGGYGAPRGGQQDDPWSTSSQSSQSPF